MITDRAFAFLVVALVIVAVLYNAILAIISAHIKILTAAAPVASEALLISGAMVLAFVRSRPDTEDMPALALLYLYMVIAVFTSLASGAIFPDALRNVAIIVAFYTLGRRCNSKEISSIFLTLTIITLAILILEISSSKTYVDIFQPGSYYSATRGVKASEYNDTGLFNNALGFGSRFSYGIFSGARTSSIFLEQVSLANFAGVLCIFLVSRWKATSNINRTVIVSTVILILLSNNTRTTSVLAAITMSGYFLYPLFSRKLILLVAPMLVGLAFVVAGAKSGVTNDDIVGRLSVTTRALYNLNISDVLGLNALRARSLMDTGFGYIIVSGTIFGMVALWLFFSLAQPVTNSDSRRSAWATAIYLFANMMIGGTAIFSMKVAAPLWTLIGFMGVLANSPKAKRTDENGMSSIPHG
jgi:hypothetical protein